MWLQLLSLPLPICTMHAWPQAYHLPALHLSSVAGTHSENVPLVAKINSHCAYRAGKMVPHTEGGNLTFQKRETTLKSLQHKGSTSADSEYPLFPLKSSPADSGSLGPSGVRYLHHSMPHQCDLFNHQQQLHLRAGWGSGTKAGSEWSFSTQRRAPCNRLKESSRCARGPCA